MASIAWNCNYKGGNLMKRILILVLPLVLFAGFLSIKPPSIDTGAQPTTSTTPQANQVPASPNSDQAPTPERSDSVAPGIKPSISGGDDDDEDDDDDDDDDDEDEDEDDDEEKPRYGGHDDDDYDD